MPTLFYSANSRRHKHNPDIQKYIWNVYNTNDYVYYQTIVSGASTVLMLLMVIVGT